MRDQYIGIDLHQAFFQACAVTPDGARLWEGRFPRTVPGLAALTARGTPASAVAVDASTATWHFADAVVTAVGELRIVDPWKTTRKAGYAAKTDRLDARRLAAALRRDSASASTIRRSRFANCASCAGTGWRSCNVAPP
jgi:Transposase